MKNYLFAPFKDDDDKMMTWNSCKSGIDQGIMIFLGRLESTYDVIIGELRSKNAVAVADERIIKTLEKEIRVLKADNDDLRKGCKLLKDTSHYPKEYKAEADEYFNHNPQSNKVWFFMFDERCMEHIDNLCISEDDAICSIDNERSN
tara:strand:+ start:135 stop:575 length:441 start_codon:yes stop_codon:yes gene_type:complete